MVNAPTDTVANLAAYLDQIAALNGLKLPSPPTPTSPVSFVGLDTKAQGSWVGVYGSLGYVLPGIGAALPNGQTVTPGPNLSYTWAATSTDARAVQTPDGSARAAKCWYDITSFYVDVNAGTNQTQVALYCLDWDNRGRSQRVNVLDASGNVLDTRAIAGFQGGGWLVWNVAGAVRFQFTKLTGPNAVLSAICFGGAGAPPPLPAPPPPVLIGDKIKVNASGMTASQVAIFGQAAARIEKLIVWNLPAATYKDVSVDGIWIEASGKTIDGTGGIVGQGMPTQFRPNTNIPYAGSMMFDTADLASMEAAGYLLDVVTHEMLHCLGFGIIWFNVASGLGGTDPEFTGSQAVAAYNRIFGNTAASVPIENQGGMGTADCHWRESSFKNELMTGYYNSGQPNPISAVTVGSLADIGYTVNLSAAEPYTAPGHLVEGVEEDAVRLPNGLWIVGDVSGFEHRQRVKVAR